jgi:hypothetical protein
MTQLLSEERVGRLRETRDRHLEGLALLAGITVLMWLIEIINTISGNRSFTRASST